MFYSYIYIFGYFTLILIIIHIHIYIYLYTYNFINIHIIYIYIYHLWVILAICSNRWIPPDVSSHTETKKGQCFGSGFTLRTLYYINHDYIYSRYISGYM